MPGPLRRIHKQVVEEGDVLKYVPALAPHIGLCYQTYASDLNPLSDFKVLPDDLFAATSPNGDIFLHHSNGEEAWFDVIGVIVGSCLEVPSGFPKSAFPHFRRWVKVTAMDEPFFDTATEAARILYNFLALHASDVLSQPRFSAEGTPCFRPSATTLTSLETVPDAVPVSVPPLYDQKPFEAALRAGHGKFCFSSNNEVLFFGDEAMPNGEVMRREISPNAVRVGQIVQTRMKFRLLKQEDGKFTFRELLKAIFVLNDGANMKICRDIAGGSLEKQSGKKRDVKFYMVARNNARDTPGTGGESYDIVN